MGGSGPDCNWSVWVGKDDAKVENLATRTADDTSQNQVDDNGGDGDVRGYQGRDQGRDRQGGEPKRGRRRNDDDDDDDHDVNCDEDDPDDDTPGSDTPGDDGGGEDDDADDADDDHGHLDDDGWAGMRHMKAEDCPRDPPTTSSQRSGDNDTWVSTKRREAFLGWGGGSGWDKG